MIGSSKRGNIQSSLFFRRWSVVWTGKTGFSDETDHKRDLFPPSGHSKTDRQGVPKTFRSQGQSRSNPPNGRCPVGQLDSSRAALTEGSHRTVSGKAGLALASLELDSRAA